MASTWRPVQQLQFFLGDWYFYERSQRIAVIEKVEMSGRRLLRAQTWHEDPAERILLGYFPGSALALAAEVIWVEWTKAHPPVSNRR